jgi:hypothetical protein
MVIGVARVGRPPASLSWLLVLTGLSCITYHVGLPGPAGDAGTDSVETGGAQVPDASVDQSSPSDKPGFNRPGECANPRPLWVQANAVEMIIALDRSTSMQRETFASTTRWQAARQAILASTAAHPGIQFDIEQFPSLRDCGGQTCCADWPSVQPYHSTSIEEQLACGLGDAGCPNAGDDSPSHWALHQCREYFNTEGSQGQLQFVLLVTDKDPSCAGDVSTDGLPCDRAVNEASKLGKNLNVQTFVVALNNDGHSPDCLKQIVSTNALNFSGDLPQLVVATDQDQLSAGFETIMTSVEANLCRFSLSRPPSNPDQVSITLDHVPVKPDPTGQQGWRFSDPNSSEIVLAGPDCKKLTSAQGALKPSVQDCWP